jgi:hypothetical protein
MTPNDPLDAAAPSVSSVVPSSQGPPAVPARKRSGGTAPSDLDVATYSAARGFLAAEWFGATLMVSSFTLLYLLSFGAHAEPKVTYTVCLGLLVLGTFVYFRSRAYYARVGADIAPRSHAIAAVVAGSAGIFWLLFLLLIVLAWLGVPLQ